MTNPSPCGEIFECPYCRCVDPPVDVHGHFQCVRCKMNVDPCCTGERADQGD